MREITKIRLKGKFERGSENVKRFLARIGKKVFRATYALYAMVDPWEEPSTFTVDLKKTKRKA